MRTVEVLGSTIALIDVPTLVDRIEIWIEQFREDRRCRRVVVTGFHGTWEAHKNPAVHEILNSADLWVPDGIAPVFVARLKGLGPAVRTPGHDILRAFLTRANVAGYRSFFLGDTPETLETLSRVCRAEFPGHVVAGVFSPPFRPLTEADNQEMIGRINDARPDVLWVGLGCPKQDRWIFENQDRLDVPVALGVGVAFRFQARIVERAPRRVGDAGLEWAWRLAKEPRKLWRRDFIEGAQFVVSVAKELLGGGPRHRDTP